MNRVQSRRRFRPKMCLYPLAQSNLYRSAATVHDHSSAGIELLPPSFLFLTPFLSYSLLCLPPCQLALVAITDHHTRIVAGGSTLPPTAPCVGLLFGQQDGLKVTICDAVETEHSFASTTGEGDFGGGPRRSRPPTAPRCKPRSNCTRRSSPRMSALAGTASGSRRPERVPLSLQNRISAPTRGE